MMHCVRVVVFLLLCGITRIGVSETLVYVGTYTGGNSSSEGIYVCRLDESSGALSSPVLAARITNPSFVALHPNQPRLYAVSEVSQSGPDVVGLTAFRIENDGRLTRLNGRTTKGTLACHVSVDPTGRCVGVANYGSGSCILYPLAADGSLGTEGSFHQHQGGSGGVPRRQSSPHAHSINFNADGTQAFVADLGKDQLLIYDVDPVVGTMKPSAKSFIQFPIASGPRHFCFHPTFEYAFCNLEISSQVALLRYDSLKRDLVLETVLSTLPSVNPSINNSTAECLAHPGGRFVYVSNRGHNSIAGFTLDGEKDKFRAIGHTMTRGEIPRGFGISPDGRFLIAGNQRTGNVVSFRVNEADGTLEYTGHQVEVDAAVNIRFLER